MTPIAYIHCTKYCIVIMDLWSAWRRFALFEWLLVCETYESTVSQSIGRVEHEIRKRNYMKKTENHKS